MCQLSMSSNKSAAADLRVELKGDKKSETPKSEISAASTPSRSPSGFNGSITPISGPRKRKRDDSDSDSLFVQWPQKVYAGC